MNRAVIGGLALASAAPCQLVREAPGREREADCEVTTFRMPRVSCHAVLKIPGRRERLMLFPLTGDPDEGGHETQVPVLVVPGEARTHQLDGTGRGD